MEPKPVELARITFSGAFSGRAPSAVAIAPGRVNLIGEHTDYNDGFVMPMAIDRCVAVAFAARHDSVLRVRSTEFSETWEAEIGDLHPPGGDGWFDYVAAVVWALRDVGEKVTGIDLAIAGDVPVGAGLSSSAALEMAVARAVCSTSSVGWDPVRSAAICQRAENEYVGVNCGIMDQFAASASINGSALLLDCRTLEFSTVPIPPDVCVVVMDTGVRRSLAASEYNERRVSCETVVATLRRSDERVRALRDVDMQTLEAVADRLDPTDFRRATHVVTEIARPSQMADALRARNLETAGRLMDESHASLRDLYEVSCRELDIVTDIARRQDACFGARMTGAGFGGCAVALVSQATAQEFVSLVADEYELASGLEGAMYICRPSSGAKILRAPSDIC